MKREHVWLPNLTCEHCGCWGMTYEARMECRADGNGEPAAPSEMSSVDWLKITGEFSS